MTAKKRGGAKGGSSDSNMDLKSPDLDIKSILKDIEFLGFSHMTWKEKKELENKKVVSLGGKPAKKQRLPLSVARPRMKKQQEREQKLLQERAILGRFGAKFAGGPKRSSGKRKPEDRVLMSTSGRFRNGVLNVKHMLGPSSSRESQVGDTSSPGFNKGKSNKSGQQKWGKKGGNQKHH